MNIVFMGLPGAGKGTQAARVAKVIGVPHISTGDMFRAAAQEKTPLGLEAELYMERGHLVPDHVTIGIVKQRLAQADCIDGFILDGFPRTVPQAERLDQLLKDLHRQLQWVVYIDVTHDELLKRLTGRRICGQCGATYHQLFAPAKEQGRCDLCQGILLQREDDTPETVAQRLKVNKEQTNHLLQYYQSNGVLHQIDGNESINLVTTAILSLIRGPSNDCP